MRIDFDFSTQKHVDYLKDNLRPIDKFECESMGLVPSEALQLSFDISLITGTALIDNKPFCMFGVSSASYVKSIGLFWLLASKELDDKKIAYQGAKASVNIMRFLLEHFDTLMNNVASNNLRSLKWLKWLGATIEECKPIGIHGEFFNMVTIKKEDLR